MIVRRMWVIVLALSMSGCAARSTHQTGGRDFDHRLLRAMLDHLMHDIKIARACPGKNIRPELKSFCTDLLADQSQESERLAGWLKQWYADEVREDPYSLWIESQDGAVFEKHFIKGVLDGHREVAERGKECVERAKRPELREFCIELQSHRTEEARKLEAWNCQWFAECK